MGGFFGIVSNRDCMADVYFGVDYHSHLGTKMAGLASYDKKIGLQSRIHNIGKSPFRAKFAQDLSEMEGTSGIGCISDSAPQPLVIRSNLGMYAICAIGRINNCEELIGHYLSFSGGYFSSIANNKVNPTELVAALINQKDSFAEGIRFAQETIDGSVSILILKEDGNIIVARDMYGRLPVLIGKNEYGFAVTMESFAYQKLDMEDYYELGSAEIVELSSKDMKVLAKAKKKMKMCSFFWSYYGYPTSTYEGVNVEVMRTRNGEKMAKNEMDNGTIPDVDYVCGVPDSGTPHAIGYSNSCHIPFARPYIKYTPSWSRSFLQDKQTNRDETAKMKQIPVKELIKDKKLLFVDDSIVRGTQLEETVDFLKQSQVKEIHMRSACPPIMYGCKYLNFSRETSDMELLSRRMIVELEGDEGLKHLDEYSNPNTERGKAMRKHIAEKFGFDSIEYQTLDGVLDAIGIDPCKLCTYCWNGKE